MKPFQVSTNSTFEGRTIAFAALESRSNLAAFVNAAVGEVASTTTNETANSIIFSVPGIVKLYGTLLNVIVVAVTAVM